MNKSIRAVAAALMAQAIIFGFVGRGQALETQLAGVRLNESIMNFITRPGWGLPEGIGPTAQTGVSTAAAAGPATRTATTSAGSGAADKLSPMEAYAQKMGASGTGARPGGVASPARTTTAKTTTTATAKPTKDQGELSGTGGMQYWLYSKSGGVRIVLGVEPSGNIATITVQGPPNPSIRTSRGIGLGSSYFDLINFYGYPEDAQPISSGLKIAYPDQDVTFLLQNLQVTEITIGQPPALTQSATQKVTAAAAGATGGKTTVRPGMPGFVPPTRRK